MRASLIALLLVACGGSSTPTDDGSGSGRCGAVTEHAVTVTIRVVDGAGQAVEGASVAIEERAWEPGTLGSATTSADGTAMLPDLAITGVEDCWGVVLDYVAVVELGERSAEVNLNSTLFATVSAGETTVARDVTLP